MELSRRGVFGILAGAAVSPFVAKAATGQQPQRQWYKDLNANIGTISRKDGKFRYDLNTMKFEVFE